MERWAVLSGDGREAACDIGVNALRGPDSRWPVDTGRSKRAWQRLGNQSTSRIHNPAFYASYAEQGIPSPRTRGAARRTLARAAPPHAAGCSAFRAGHCRSGRRVEGLTSSLRGGGVSERNGTRSCFRSIG